MESGQGRHSYVLNDRKEMRIDGVNQVVSFDERYIMLKTQCGDMTIEGNNLKIAVLEIDTGIVVLSGTVSGVYYSETQNTQKQSLLKKLFK